MIDRTADDWIEGNVYNLLKDIIKISTLLAILRIYHVT